MSFTTFVIAFALIVGVVLHVALGIDTAPLFAPPVWVQAPVTATP